MQSDAGRARYEPSLSTEVQYVKGVGPKLAVGLNKAGIFTVGDLLFRMPRRYEDRSSIPPISSVQPGDWVTVHGVVKHIEARPLRGGKVVVKAILRDGTGSIALTWFNQPWIKTQLEKASGEIYAYGQAKLSGNHLEIGAPEWEAAGDEADPEEFGKIIPVYPLTEGLSQKTMRRAVRSALHGYLDAVQEPLPLNFRRAKQLQNLKWTLQQIHLPDDEASKNEARRRLVFEEFFYMQVALAMRRRETQIELGTSFPVQALLAGSEAAQLEVEDRPVGSLFESPGQELRIGEPLWDQIHRVFPFELTRAQRRVIQEIWNDMAAPHPMNRLIQGDVGSGKTAVAVATMLTAVRAGFQAAVMAPTEILAEQHFFNIRNLLEPLGIQVTLIIGKQGVRERRRVLNEVATGSAHIVVGTHALIQDSVSFAKLGLIVVDEQHKFGVLQRKALRDKGVGNPDVLIMTATPIPRTLTMAVYGDLDISVIDELPPGRQPIKTHWKRVRERPGVYEAVRAMLKEGRQAYFVCSLVSETENMMAQAAEDLHYRLSEHVFKEWRVEKLHGQMKPSEKEAIMERFRRHEIDVLVSTTVIEVGVDVANASVMVIEDANRFGLAQLHQLRGRVGRGVHQSFCILVADATGEDSRNRLEVMTSTNDGFEIAEADLRLRGPGVLAGTMQSGNADFLYADLLRDTVHLEQARAAAQEVVAQDPELKSMEWQRVLSRIRNQRSDIAVITVS